MPTLQNPDPRDQPTQAMHHTLQVMTAGNVTQPPPNVDAIIEQALSRQASTFQKTFEQMSQKISELELHIAQSGPNKVLPTPARKEDFSKAKKPREPNGPTLLAKTKPKQKAPAPPVNKRAALVVQSTKPKPFRRAQSEPAQNLLSTPVKNAPNPRAVTNSSATKKKPNQMTMSDFPVNFKNTKECLFTHIRLLWGLLETNSVPPAANPEYIRQFCSAFNTIGEFERFAQDSNAAQLITNADVITLKGARAGKIKVGRNLIHIEETYLAYIHAYLAKVGIRCWGPNLEETAESLFNAACRISAISIFRQIAVAGAYDFMGFNHAYKDDVLLMTRAYNHYVHHVMAAKFKVECKQNGKNQDTSEARSAQKNRSRLRDARWKFAVAMDLPERYKRIIAEVGAHSDDERASCGRFSVVKTLPYRSSAANIFFRQLDKTMANAAKASGKVSRARERKVPKILVPSRFTKPPPGMPLDFYKLKVMAEWPTAQQMNLPDISSVAFLPHVEYSLLPKNHPHFQKDEKLSDRQFNKKYLESVVARYRLTKLVDEELKEEEEEQDEEEEDEEDVIDLEQESHDETDEYVSNNDWGNVYCSEDDVDFDGEDTEGGEESEEGGLTSDESMEEVL